METNPLTVAQRVFDVYYADLRTFVVMEADLERGWEKLEKTYGFFRQTRIPYKGDLKIRAQLQVIAQPGSFGPWAQEFPDSQLNSDDPLFSYSVISKRLKVKISLSVDQAWQPLVQYVRYGKHRKNNGAETLLALAAFLVLITLAFLVPSTNGAAYVYHYSLSVRPRAVWLMANRSEA